MIELNTLTLDELIALKEDVDDAIHVAQADLKAMALKEIEAIALEHGIPLYELLGTRKGKSGNGKKKSYVPGKPKYRNPHNPDQTWTGKGTRPGWFVVSLASGMTPEQMLI